jgi:uncharacterized LabA/DUF88 family protein
VKGLSTEAPAAGNRTAVYIDGFNLYYGAIRGTRYHWLDVQRTCEVLLKDLDVVKIKYFTAIVSARPGDPEKPLRHQIYLRALQTLPKVEVILGQFLTQRIMLPLADPVPGGPRFARVVRTEEKGSDVNLATHLVHDGHLGRYDVAVVISNDSDLLEPLRIVRHELRRKIGIVNPRQQHPTRVLMAQAHFIRQLRPGLLRSSQLPPVLRDIHGEFHCPKKWRSM